MAISVLSSRSGQQATVGSKTTPFSIEVAALVNDAATLAALVKGIHRSEVVAVSENGQILAPKAVSALDFAGMAGIERWVETGPLNIARSAHPCAALPNGKAVVAGGSGGKSSSEVYDEATGEWTLAGDLHYARQESAAVALLSANKALIIGGATNLFDYSTYTPVCEVFDGVSNTFADGAAFPTGIVGGKDSHDYCPACDPIPVCIIKGGPHDGKIFIAGGMGRDDSWTTDPIPAWQASTAYSLGEFVSNGGSYYKCSQAGTSAASGGPTGTGTGISDGTAKWFFTTPGQFGAGYLGCTPHTRIYDPIANTMKICTPMNVARSITNPVAIGGGKVMMIGGWNDRQNFFSGATATVEVYDSALDTWTLKASMPPAPEPWSLETLTGYTLGEPILDPTSGDRACITPILVENGTKILVIGGFGKAAAGHEGAMFGPGTFGVRSRSTLALYTIATDSWVILSGQNQRLFSGRGYGFVTVLNGSKAALSLGGIDKNLNNSDNTEIVNLANYQVRVAKMFPRDGYDPNGPDPLIGAWFNWAATKLTTGDFLMAGGPTPNFGPDTASCIIWQDGIPGASQPKALRQAPTFPAGWKANPHTYVP